MKTYKVIDLQKTNFMSDTWQDPMTINQLRGRFWGLDENQTDNFKDFTSDYIEENWQVELEEVKKIK